MRWGASKKDKRRGSRPERKTLEKSDNKEAKRKKDFKEMRATSHMKQTRRGNRLGARPSWPEQVQRSTAGRNHGVAEEEMRGQTSLSGNSVGQAARNGGAETKWVFSVKATDARGLFNDGSEPTD